MGEQPRRGFHKSGEPESRLPGPLLKAFMLPHHPSEQMSVNQTKCRIKRRFVETPEVADPTFNLSFKHTGQIDQPLVATPLQSPIAYPTSKRLERFWAGRRKVGYAKQPSTPDRQPGLEPVAEKVESNRRERSFPVGILAVDDLCLLRMKRQSTVSETIFDLLP